MKFRAVLLTLLGFCCCAAAQNPESAIRVWPRQAQVSWPTGLKQFMFVEFPATALPEGGEIAMTMPPEVKLLGVLSGASPAVPPARMTVKPLEWRQDGSVFIFKLAAGALTVREDAKHSGFFLPLFIDVETEPGDYQMKIELLAAGKPALRNDFPVRVYPALSGKTSSMMPIGVWYYTGIAPEYVRPFMDQMTAAGINAFYSMEGEHVSGGEIPELTVADVTEEYGVELGTVFFAREIAAQAKKLFGDEYSLQKLIDEPDKLKQAIRAHIDWTTGGKPQQLIIYDAEAGSVREDHVEGDLSEYGRAKFSREVGSAQTLTPERIFNEYRDEWMWFNCRQSNAIAAATREVLDEDFPGVMFKVYSGYEYDFAPHENLSRRNYSVDWKSMGDNMIDYAGAGYYGTRQDLKHTFEVLEGRTTYIPADMYIENFLSAGAAPTVDQWKMRLIRTFMDSGMRGISLWYAAVMDGGALVAVDEFAKFMLMIEDFAARGQLDQDAVAVAPKTEADNVYVIRDSKRAMVVILNNTDKAKNLTLTLKDFKIKGYTSDVQITDMTTGEKFPSAATLRFKVEPMSYRVINILDDGN